MRLYPFLFQPIFQERIWGGRRIETLYGKALPPGATIGESWEISDREEAQSIIANGPLAGRSLHWLMETHGQALLGEAADLQGRFPLLVKILDAEDKLSLQVHPPASKAKALGGDPKTEMWYITQARPGAELFVGLKPGASRAEFESRISSGSVAECFHRVPVRAGDAMFLPSGRVHAIGAGLVIFEIQQNSDTTYRVFDWNRRDAKGQARELHVSQSLESIDFADCEPQPVRPDGSARQVLVNDPLFRVEIASIRRGAELALALPSVHVAAVVEGSVTVDGSLSLAAGQFCLLPAQLERVTLGAASDARVLLAVPGRA